MENFKKSNKITCLVLLLLFFIYSCKGQEEKLNYAKLNNMEKDFDVNRFETFLENGGDSTQLDRYTLFYNENDKLIEEYKTLSSDNEFGYVHRIHSPEPALFYTIKEYDENGKIITTQDNFFYGYLDFDYGTEIIYKNNGEVKEIKDYTSRFKDVPIKLEDLFKILEKEDVAIGEYDKDTKYKLDSRWFHEGSKETYTNEEILEKMKYREELPNNYRKFEPKMLNPYNREDVKTIKIIANLDKNNWTVIKNIGDTLVTMVYDNRTGKRLDVEFEIIDNN